MYRSIFRDRSKPCVYGNRGCKNEIKDIWHAIHMCTKGVLDSDPIASDDKHMDWRRLGRLYESQ